MQPFLLKALHIVSDILVDCPDSFQNHLTKHIFTNIVCAAHSTTTFVAGTNIMVLLALKALASGKVQLVSTVRAEQKPGEEALPFRFCGAAFVFAKLLHPVPLCL